MIDHMEDMVASSMAVGADGNMNFQMASGAVEAGVKIYSSRVDSVATEAYKVLGNLSRANNKDGARSLPPRCSVPRAALVVSWLLSSARVLALCAAAEGDEEDGGAEGAEEGAEGAGKKKRRARSGGSTLETNPDNLNLKDLDYQITTDPLFQKTSASFDEGGAKGMLLNNLSVQNGCCIVFDSSDAIDEAATDETPAPENDDDDALDLGDVAGELKDLLSSIGGAELTPGFTQFRLGQTPQDGPEKSLDIGTSPAPAFGTHNQGSVLTHEAVAAEEPTSYDDAAAFVDDGADFDDDDDDAPEDFGGDAGYTDDPDAGFSGAPTAGGEADPLDFPMELMQQQAAGGVNMDFMEGIFGGNWAGPGGMWKASKKEKTEGAKAEKVKKEKFMIDFTVEVPASALQGGARNESYMLSDAVVDNTSEEATTMPEDLHYELRDLCTLFTKPSVAVRSMGQSAGAGNDGAAAGADGWYDYGNENDVENFCPDMDGGGADDDDDDGCGGLDDGDLDDESGMIGAPQLVGDTRINYARVANKVDVHVLKEAMLETLEDQVLEDKPLSDKSNKKGKKKGDDNMDFQEVITGINGHVSTEKKELLKDANVSFCFICLLHLANEKNLVLTDDKLGKLNMLAIGPDGSAGAGTGSCDW